MNKFLLLYRSDAKKFLNWKILLISALLVVTLALISMSVFEQFYGELNRDPEFSASEEQINSYKGELEQVEKQIDAFIAEHPNNYSNQKVYISMLLQKNYYEYLIKHNLSGEGGYEDIRSIENYILFTQYFLVGVYLLIICFAANLITKEYRTKRVNELYTYPVGKGKIYMSKFATMATYSTMMVSLYFLVVSIIMTKYRQYGNITANMFYDIILLTPIETTLIYYLTSIVAGISLGAMTIFFSYAVKNNFITIPIFSVIFCLLPLTHMLGFGFAELGAVAAFLPSANMLLPMQFITARISPDAILSAPYISVAVHLILIAISVAGGLYFNKKQNIKV